MYSFSHDYREDDNDNDDVFDDEYIYKSKFNRNSKYKKANVTGVLLEVKEKERKELQELYREKRNRLTKRRKHRSAIFADMVITNSSEYMAKIDEENEEQEDRSPMFAFQTEISNFVCVFTTLVEIDMRRVKSRLQNIFQSPLKDDNNLTRGSPNEERRSVNNLKEWVGRSSSFIKKNQDQYSGFQKNRPKMIGNGPESGYRNSFLSGDFSESPRNSVAESSVEEIHICEQDLGSDAESLPSCDDSYPVSESPSASPEMRYESHKVTTVGLSAPDLTALNYNDSSKVRKKLRRRNSSVDVRINKVRCHLEETFKNEKSRFEKTFHANVNDNETDTLKTWSPNFEISSVAENTRKISLPSIEKTERKRKTSVFSDTSEKPIDIISNINSNANRKISLQEERNNGRIDSGSRYRKASLQETTISENKSKNRKQSLQEQHISVHKADRKNSWQENMTWDRKISLQDHRKLSLQFQDRKLSQQERKVSTERKLSIPFERKVSSSERKTSFTDTVRAVVGTKKKTDRKASLPESSSSPDENNNTSADKKSTWGMIKNKIKKDRKHSENSPKNSPRTFRQLSRNDSGSSNDSFKRSRSDSHSRYQVRAYSEQDRNSISSFTSFELDEHSHQLQAARKTYELPSCSFDVWSEGKVDLKTDNKSLPLLHVAAGEGNFTLLKTLLDVGVEVNEIDYAGWPALHYAVCAGHFKCAQLLIEKGAILKSYSNKVTNSYCAAIRNCIMSP